MNKKKRDLGVVVDPAAYRVYHAYRNLVELYFNDLEELCYYEYLNRVHLYYEDLEAMSRIAGHSLSCHSALTGKMLSNAPLPSLPPSLRKAKRSAASSSSGGRERRSSKRQRNPERRTELLQQDDDGVQGSHQVQKLIRHYRPIVDPEDYVIPFKQVSSLKELIDRHSDFLEMVNRIYRCIHCGLNYKATINYQFYECSFHPGIPIFDSEKGASFYTCCDTEYPDRGLGCMPCMHSRNEKARERIVHTREPLFLSEELVDAALAEGGVFAAGEPTPAMIYMALMSKSTPYSLPDQFTFAVRKEMISHRKSGRCYFPTSLFTAPPRNTTSTTRAKRSLLAN